MREARAPYRTQPRFAGSSRYFRGRIVAALRELPLGQALSLEELGHRFKPDFATTDLDWLRGLVEGLAADGLVSVEQAADSPAAWHVALP